MTKNKIVGCVLGFAGIMALMLVVWQNGYLLNNPTNADIKKVVI